jgi:predicted DNA-binding protein YlxM (UPF0122 family)
LGNKSIKNNIQVEKIIYHALLKKKMTILKIIYKPYLVSIFLYNDYIIYKKQNRQIRLYYKKVLSLQKIVEKFGLKKKKILRLLKKTKLKKYHYFNLIGNLMMLNFFYKRYFLC